MKSRFALLAMMLIAVVPLSAQGGGGRNRNGGGGRNGGAGGAMNVENLATMYKLTADQKTKTEALVKAYTDSTQKTQAWMASEQQAGGARNADSLKKITDARATFDAGFKALLTAPQAETYDSVQKAQAGRRRGGGGGF